MIHGGMGREERRKAQESFLHDPEVQVLLATDAAGEGINLQRAHLMVNYDLPWNPNRLEQRFGRIHRIGQTEVCHLWNLVAEETREGDVYRRLLEKLEEARQALGGQVFDVLGKLQFEGRPLRDLLIEAIRYGDQPEVRARLTHGRRARASTGRTSQDLLEERALAHDAMDASRVRAHPRGDGARRGAPPAAALHRVVLPRGLPAPGRHRPRSASRAATRSPTCPAPVRNRDRQIGIGRAGAAALRAHRLREGADRAAGPAARRLRLPGPPAARRRPRPHARAPPRSAEARHGAGGRARPRHAARACSSSSSTPSRTRASLPSGERRTISRRMLYVEMDADGHARHLHYAPYLDYRPLAEGEPAVADHPRPPRVRLDHPRRWSRRRRATPSRTSCPSTSPRCAAGRLALDRQDRGRGEGPADQGDHLLGPPRRAAQAPGAGRQGRTPGSTRGEARKRADDLQARLQKRLAELNREAQISPLPPVVLGGLLVVPLGLLAAMTGRPLAAPASRRRHPGQRRPRPRHRHGGRAQPRLRADRPRVREARLRHREPRPRHRASCASSR